MARRRDCEAARVRTDQPITAMPNGAERKLGHHAWQTGCSALRFAEDVDLDVGRALSLVQVELVRACDTMPCPGGVQSLTVTGH